MEKENIEIIKGLNKEKEILTISLTRVGHNQAIQIKRRLSDIDGQLQKFMKLNPPALGGIKC